MSFVEPWLMERRSGQTMRNGNPVNEGKVIPFGTWPQTNLPPSSMSAKKEESPLLLVNGAAQIIKTLANDEH